jgi:phage recombination protein Bet
MAGTTGTALAIRREQVDWDVDQLAVLRQMGLEKVSTPDLKMFFHYAQRTGLDPFTKQIYLIRRGDRWVVQTSIDSLRIVAQRSMQYEGQTDAEWCDEHGNWSDVWLLREAPMAARVGVYRRGFRGPLRAVAHWREYGERSRGETWHTLPAHMLAKCAEALALRKAFPNDLSGLYTAEEMAQGDTYEDTSIEAVNTQPVTLDDILSEVAAARSRNELAAVWRTAAAHGLLGQTVPDTDPAQNLNDFITAYNRRLQDAQRSSGKPHPTRDGSTGPTLGEGTGNPAPVAPEPTAEETARDEAWLSGGATERAGDEGSTPDQST